MVWVARSMGKGTRPRNTNRKKKIPEENFSSLHEFLISLWSVTTSLLPYFSLPNPQGQLEQEIWYCKCGDGTQAGTILFD